MIAICGVLFAIEFIGDKIPVFDLLWNAMHTFVRVPAAALLTYAATAQLPEWERLAATFVGASIALAAHAGKVAARTAVTGSPEPFSNMALSMGEDAAGCVSHLVRDAPCLRGRGNCSGGTGDHRGSHSSGHTSDDSTCFATPNTHLLVHQISRGGLTKPQLRNSSPRDAKPAFRG